MKRIWKTGSQQSTQPKTSATKGIRQFRAPGKQSGFTLAELTISTMIASSLIAGIALYLKEQQDDRDRTLRATWMAQYVNAVAAFMANREDPTAADNRTLNGTDWLKSTACGGSQPDDAYYLSCDVPTNFNADYGLPAPRAIFTESETRTPQAAITFGVVQDAGGRPDTVKAAALSEEINRRLRVDGYEHAGAFILSPNTTAPANIANELGQANLRAFVDSSINSTVFVRLDGNSIMKGTLINQNDSWAVIARDSGGGEIADPANPTASLNLNDIFVRSTGMWASEIHELAEEAYRIAVRSPVFEATIRSGETITGLGCPSPLAPQVTAVPAGFVGGPEPTDPRFLAGVRIITDKTGNTYRFTMETLHDGQGDWVDIATPTMGAIKVTMKCSDP